MAKINKDGKEYFFDFNEWLRSELGQNALGHDSFGDLEALGFKQEIELGKKMHNIVRGLERVSAQYAHLGLYPVIKELPRDGGTEIIYRPRGEGSNSIKDSECPSITISKTRDGYVLNNNMLAPNSPLMVRGQNGEMGIASAVSVGLDQIAREVETNMSRLQGELSKSLKKGMAKVRSTTSQAFRSATQMSPSVYSYNQIKEYSELDMKNMKVLRPEALQAMKSQLITGYYIQSVYNNSSKSGSYGAPNEKRFTQMMNEIFSAARGFENFSQIDNYVRSHYSWIYQNVWKGDVANVFKKITGKITQGGMTEGTMGRIAFKEADVPFGSLAAPGKKIKQNLQLLTQNSNFIKGKKTAASGNTRIFSPAQYNSYQKKIKTGEMSQEDMFKDLYTVAEFTDRDLQKAYASLKKDYEEGRLKISKKKFKEIQQMALKGFGEDASFMSASLNQEFAGMEATKYLDDGVVSYEEASKQAKAILIKQKEKFLKSKKAKRLSEQEINSIKNEIELLQKEETDVRSQKGGDRLIKLFLSKKYDLDSMSSIKSYEVDKEGNFVNVLKSRKLYNQNGVIRGGATTDWRSVMAVLNDELAGRALEIHGYTPKQIYKNGKDASDGLIPNLFNNADREINQKTIRSDVMSHASYVFNHLRNEGRQVSEIRELLKNSYLGNYFSVAKDGSILTHEKQFEKDFKTGTDEGKEAATNLLKKIVEFGQEVGAYDKNTKYFDEFEIDGKKYLAQLAPLMSSTELGFSSTERYAGLGRASHSTAKKTWREMQSAEGTLGEFSEWLLNRGYQGEAYDKAIAPMRNYVEALREQFKEKEKDYQSYVKNAQYMSKTFTRDAIQFQRDVNNDKRVIKLTLDDIMKLDAEVNYDADNLVTGEKIEGNFADSNKLGIYLKKRREHEYGLLSQEELEQLGIKSAEDLQFAVDLGDKSLTGKINDQLLTTRMVMLGKGSYSEGSAKEGIYMPDKEMAEISRMVRALQRYHTAGADEKEAANFGALRAILGAYEYLEESYSTGSIYEKFHTLEDDNSSGYLLLQGMSDKASKVLKDIVNGNIQGVDAKERERINNNLNNVTRIMSTEDYKAMLRAEYKQSPEKLKELYKSIFGVGSGRMKAETIINKIAAHYDISDKNYKGDVIDTTMFNRNPTINFVNDLLGGSTVLTSKSEIVNRGNLMINKHLAGIGHGDMDGDLVAFFNALNVGDLEGAEAAIAVYYADAAKIQGQIDKEEQKEYKTIKNRITQLIKEQGGNPSQIGRFGEVAKANSVLDETSKKISIASMWSGKKGAGIYGNDKFAFEKILKDVFGAENRSADRLANLGGRVFAAIGQSLYQEGINIKNIKLKDAENLSPEEKATLMLEYGNSAMNMSTQKATWDEKDARQDFFNKLIPLGVFDESAMFKGNTLQTIGLNRITKGSPLLNDLANLAERTKVSLEERYGADSEQVKRINEDLKHIKSIQKKGGTLTNLSLELTNALVDVFASDASFAGEGKSLGSRVSNLYSYIPGYSSSNPYIPRLGVATGFGDYDARSKEILGRYLDKAQKGEIYQDRYHQILNAESSGYSTSPSADTKKAVLEGKGNLPVDFEITKLAQAYSQATDQTVRDQLIQQRNAWHQNKFIEKSIPAIKAVLKGEIAHRVSELMDKNQNGQDFKDVNEAFDYLLNNDGTFVKQIDEQIGFALNDEFGGKDKLLERSNFIAQAAFAGGANYNVLQRKIKEEGGTRIGSEIPLLGYSNVENGKYNTSRQISDYLYYTVDGNGKTTIHIADYKNASDGKPTLANITQLKDYQDSLQILASHVSDLQTNKGITFSGAEDFFGSGSNIANDWKKRIIEEATKDAGGQSQGRVFEEAFEKRKSDFSKLIKVLSTGVHSFAADLIVQSANGIISDYSINLNDDALKQWFYEHYKNKNIDMDDYLLKHSDEAKALFERSIGSVKTSFGGTQEQLEYLYSKENEGAKKSIDEFYKAQTKLSNLQLKKDSLEREIPSEKVFLEQQELTKQIEELKQQIGSKKDFEKVAKLEEEGRELQKLLIGKDRKTGVEAIEVQNKIQSLADQIAQIKESFYYKMESGIADIGGTVSYDKDGNPIFVGKDMEGTLNLYKQDWGKALEDNKKTVAKSIAREQLIGHNIEYEKYAKAAAEAQAKAESPLLDEDARKIAEAEAKNMAKLRDRVRKAILEEQTLISTKARKNSRAATVLEGRVYRDINGKIITAEEAKKEGLWSDLDSVDNSTLAEAQKNQVARDKKAMVGFETKAIQYYRDEYKIENQINDTNEKIEKAKVENNELELERLTLEKDRLTQMLQLHKELEHADLKSVYGYTEQGEAKAKKYAELLEHREKTDAEKNKRPLPPGGGDGGMFGIDSATSRWLSRLLNGGLVMRFIAMIRRGFKDITNKAKQLDQAMTNLRIVTGKNADNARILINGYAELGKKLGATTVEVTNAAQAWLRQGYDIAQVNDLVKSSLYLSKLGMIDTATATQNLTSAMHGFKLEASEAMNIVDKLTALDVKAATTAGDIAQGLSQFANIASLGGVSIDQAAAYVATIADVNQMSGITVGQSLKTIMSRYGNVKAGAYNKLNVDSESSDTSEKLNDVERVLTKMGISIRKTNLEFKDFDEVLDEIAGKWNNLDNVSKRAIANAFAGVRQQEAFMILLENYDKYKDLVEVSENSKGTAERKYQSYKESYAFAKNEFTAALEQFTNSSELSKLLTELTKVGTNIVSALQKIYPFLPGIISNFMMYRTIQGKGLFNQGYNLLNRYRGKGAGYSGFGGQYDTYGYHPYRAGGRFVGGLIQKFRTKGFQEATMDENSEAYHTMRRKYNYLAHKKGLSKADKYWYKVSTPAEQKQKDILQKKEQTLLKQRYQYALKELNLKRDLLTPAQQEVMSAEVQLQSETKKELIAKGLVQKEEEKLTYAKMIALLESGILDETKLKEQIEEQIYNIDLQRKITEENIAKENIKNAKQAQDSFKKTGGLPADPQMIRQQNIRKGISYAEMGANLLVTSLSQLKTAAVTHKYEGETVESSEEAQKKGSGWSAALSLIPVVGTFIGPLVGEAIAAETDKLRDAANYRTKTANERINKLESLTGSLDQLNESEVGSAERHKLVQEFKKNIFDQENADLRKQLQRHLGGTSISSLLESIDSNTSDSQESLKALKQLQIAQIQSEKEQVFNKYASTMYEDNRELNDTIAKIDEYTGEEGSTALNKAGIATTGTLAGAGSGALTGLAIGTIGNIPGWIIGTIVGAAIGAAAGTVGAEVYAEGEKAANKANYNDLSKVDNWGAQNSIERTDTIKESLEETQKSIEEIELTQDTLRQNFIDTFLKRNEQQGALSKIDYTIDDAMTAYAQYKIGAMNGGLNTEEEKAAARELKNSEEQLKKLSTLVSEYNNMITILERQTSVEMQILSEMNDLTLQEALVKAQDKDKNKYITEMSIAELKHVGIDEILTSYANAIEDSGGLKGIGIWANAGRTRLSEAGYEYLFEQLKKQGDEEINAVLGGQAYTLQEAIDLRTKFGADSFQVKKILASFSDAFNLVAEDIEDGTDKLKETLSNYGLLTLADGMASTSELTEKVGSFTDLMSSIVNGAGETSAWMEKIISQFPQLIEYMGDTSKLFAQSITYLEQLSKQYINAQTDEYLQSDAYYSSIEEKLYKKLGENSDAARSLRASKASNLSGVITWIQTQYVNGQLTVEAEEVLAKLVEVTEEAGTKIVSKIDKAFYDQLIEYKTKTIDYILENLNSQKEALQNINSEREYENKLIEARLKLEEASKEKKRVYRAGVGWVYESDQSAIENAQENLKSLETEKQISKLDVQIATFEGIKAEINGVYDKENYENLQKLYNQALEEGKVQDTMNGFLSDIKDSVDGIVKKLSEKIKEDVVPGAQEEKKVDMTEAKRAWKTLLEATPGTEKYNTAVNNFHTAMAKAQANGATEEDVKDWDSYYKTGARIEKGAKPWQVYKGAVEEQTQKTKHTFNVAADKNDSNKRFIGYTNGDRLYDTQVQTWLLDGIKSGNALAWAMTDEGLVGPISVGSDARFKYQDDKSLLEYFTRITTSYPTLGKQILISDPGGENEAVMYDGEDLYKVTNNSDKDLNGLLAAAAKDVGSTDQFFKAWEGEDITWEDIKEQYAGGFNHLPSSQAQELVKAKVKSLTSSLKFAKGSLGTDGSLNLINEEGTEAIITPQGTLTALPSGTGIVPADITRNLWELGEVAPELLRILGNKLPSGLQGTSILDRIVNDESFNISNLTMNVDADGSFDVDKFVNSIKSRVALTKNNSK